MLKPAVKKIRNILEAKGLPLGHISTYKDGSQRIKTKDGWVSYSKSGDKKPSSHSGSSDRSEHPSDAELDNALKDVERPKWLTDGDIEDAKKYIKSMGMTKAIDYLADTRTFGDEGADVLRKAQKNLKKKDSARTPNKDGDKKSPDAGSSNPTEYPSDAELDNALKDVERPKWLSDGDIQDAKKHINAMGMTKAIEYLADTRTFGDEGADVLRQAQKNLAKKRS